MRRVVRRSSEGGEEEDHRGGSPQAPVPRHFPRPSASMRAVACQCSSLVCTSSYYDGTTLIPTDVTDFQLLFHCFDYPTTTPSSVQDCFADRRPAWTVSASGTLDGTRAFKLHDRLLHATPALKLLHRVVYLHRDQSGHIHLLFRVLWVASHQWMQT